MAKKEFSKESGLTFEAKCWRVFDDEKNLLGSFSVTVNGSLVIKDVLLMKGKKKDSKFISMPSRSYKDGKEIKYVDICFLLDKTDREALYDAVIEAYEEFED